MAYIGDDNFGLVSDYTYQQYSPPVVTATVTNISGTTSTVITTINGNSGQATGPSITLSGGSTGYDFVASSGNISLTVSSAATARTAIGAAASGANADLNTFAVLTGAGGWANWTGTQDRTSHATYPATVASVGYVQAEMQGLMDKMQQTTEALFAVLTTLFAWGGART